MMLQPNAHPFKTRTGENNEGTPALEQSAASLGVVRHLTETYSVGEFQYTNLTDAVAQARRVAKLEKGLK